MPANRKLEALIALALTAGAFAVALAAQDAPRDRASVIATAAACALGGFMLAVDALLPLGRSKIGIALDAVRMMRRR